MSINRNVEHPRPSAKSMKWFHQNRKWLEDNHAGKWVAIGPDGLLAVGDTLDAAADEAKSKGHDDPLLTGIRRKELQGVDLIRQWL
jgi:hypothetical protein